MFYHHHAPGKKTDKITTLSEIFFLLGHLTWAFYQFHPLFKSSPPIGLHRQAPPAAPKSPATTFLWTLRGDLEKPSPVIR
jgi:hypothetical protein